MIEIFKEKLDKNGEVYIKVKAKPGSSKTEIVSVMEDEAIKINIKAVPEKGKANIELIKYLSKVFLVYKNNVKIISGAGDRVKLIKIIKNEE